MTAFPKDPIFRLLSAAPLCTGKDIEAATGESRITVTQKIAALMEAGLIVRQGHAASGGGRPARLYAINPNHRNLIGVDMGEKMVRVCLFDLSYRFLDERLMPIDLRADPQIALAALEGLVRDLAASPAATAPVAACGIGLPAPVDQRQGQVTAPSVMYGWEGLDLRRALCARLGLPVAIDNDVNLMCLAEYRLHETDCRTFVFVKAGTGIGCGILNEGRLFRGAFGASGDIGHIQHTDPPLSLCRCGKEGCVESQAAGWAIARDLTALGLPASDARDVMALYHRGEPECRKAINRSSRVIGTVIADLVAILNPDMIVLGGRLATSGEAMLAGIRERIYQKCLPLATQRLRIRTSCLDERLGAMGAAMLALESAMA